MSEATLMTQMQSELRSIPGVFANNSVVINDWGIFDGSSLQAPFALIEDSDSIEVTSTQIGQITKGYEIGITLIVRFTNWKPTLDEFVSLRDMVLSHFTEILSETSGVLEFSLRGIRNGTDVYGIYDRYVEEKVESLPVFLAQKLLFKIEETELN